MNVRKTLSLLLALALCLGLLVAPAGAAEFTRGKTYTPGQFTDVPESAWYAASVKDCFELGLMSGNSADSFNPTGLFTLAEAATIAARMHNLYAGGNGVMPPSVGAWYQSAVDYCVKNGIFGAEEFNSFTRNATRAEMAGIMAKALPDSAWEAKNSVTALPDVNRATSYADAIFKLYDAGVFTGSDDYGMFQPQASITRAEVAAIAARCADQSQRKALSLKPLSQREAPVLIGGYDKDSKMSNGRLRFRDPGTWKYGYLDGNGNVAIAAQYGEAEGFKGSYAVVRVGAKQGLIDVNGNVTTPIEYGGYTLADFYRIGSTDDWVVAVGGAHTLIVNGRPTASTKKYKSIEPLGGGLYRVYLAKKNGAVNRAGQEIIPLQYDNITYNGLYCICSKNNKYDIYNTSGQLLASYDTAEIRSAKNSQLLAVKEGNKWALATVYGKITEAVYDSIKLKDDSDLAVVKYGNLAGLAGLNGEILAPGNVVITFTDDYVLARGDGRLKILDATGVQRDLPWTVNSTPMLWGEYLFTGGSLYDMNGEVVYSNGDMFGDIFYFQGEENGVDEFFFVAHNYYFLTESGQVHGPYTELQSGSADSVQYLECTDLDGNKDVFDLAGNPIAKPKSDPPKDYAIRNNSAGKPTVCYGNHEVGWTPVIEFYKNNMYYDEIKELGEGYYACRYNTTWYLVHAD